MAADTGKILIDTDDLANGAKLISNVAAELTDAQLEVVRIAGEMDAMYAAGQLPLKPEDMTQLHEFVAFLGKLAPGLDGASKFIGKTASVLQAFDSQGGFRVPPNAAGAVGAGGAVLGALGLGGFDKPVAHGEGKVSGFLGYQTSGEASYQSGAFKAEGGYVLKIGVGYEADGEYTLDKDGLRARGHAESMVGVYAEAYGSVEYGPAHLGGKTSSMTGSKASVDGTGNIGWGEDGPQADVGVGGKSFTGEEWNADASAGFGKLAGVSAGAGFKAGLGVQFDVGASFGFDKIGVHADIGASLGIGLELQVDLSFSPGEIVNGAFDFASGIASDPFGSIGSFGTDAFNFAGDAFSGIGGAFGDIGSGFADLGSSLADAGAGLVSDVGDFFGL